MSESCAFFECTARDMTPALSACSSSGHFVSAVTAASFPPRTSEPTFTVTNPEPAPLRPYASVVVNSIWIAETPPCASLWK